MSPGTGRLLHAAGYRVIFMECRGVGDSEHKAPFTIQQYALDAVALLDHLHIDKVTFAGHSMGGGVGYELAVNHAERLSRVVLQAPVGAGDKERIAERLASQPEGVTAETWVTRGSQPTAADYEAEMQAARNGVRLRAQSHIRFRTSRRFVVESVH